MKLKELSLLLYGNVVLYEHAAECSYSDLYKGGVRNIPSKLLDREIVVVGASTRKRACLEIQLINPDAGKEEKH